MKQSFIEAQEINMSMVVKVGARKVKVRVADVA
jgi:hypothetical protein